MIRWSALVVCMLLSNSAFAAEPLEADPIVRDFKEAAVAIPKTLLNAGRRKFGRLDLKTLIEKMDTVKVTSVAKVSHPVRVSDTKLERNSAQWRRDASGVSIEASIEVSRTLWLRTVAEERYVIALHEYFGALGFDDHNYLLSTALWFLAVEDVRQTLSRHEEQELSERIAHQAVANNGGIIGVGGGGDRYGAGVKMGMMGLYFERMKAARTAKERAGHFDGILGTLYTGTEVKRREP